MIPCVCGHPMHDGECPCGCTIYEPDDGKQNCFMNTRPIYDTREPYPIGFGHAS